VLDGDLAVATPAKGARAQQPRFRLPMSIVATVAHLSYCWALVQQTRDCYSLGGHNLKLFVSRSRLNCRKYFFSLVGYRLVNGIGSIRRLLLMLHLLMRPRTGWITFGPMSAFKASQLTIQQVTSSWASLSLFRGKISGCGFGLVLIYYTPFTRYNWLSIRVTVRQERTL